MSDHPDSELTARLTRLANVLEIADGVVTEATQSRAQALIDNASHRLRHGTQHTVVAIAGATGSGKSSVFNAVVGDEIAPSGVMRPTTSEARAAVFGGDADGLLDWLGVRHRHGIDGGKLDGLVLIDLPDHDSVEITHRMQVDRFVQMVDMLVWVLDPQKYADRVLHERYLAPLAKHTDVMVYLLHQTDLVSVEARETLTEDVVRLLLADGIAEPVVLHTSVVSGEGIKELAELIAQRIATREVAIARIDADLRQISAELEPLRLPPLAGPSPDSQRRLIDDLADSAGADGVADVVGEAYRHRARLRTGWPYTRWAARLRRNPLGRLAGTDATGRPTAAPIDTSRLDLALKHAADSAAGDLPPAWLRKVRAAAGERRGELVPALSAAVSSVVGRETAHARWWSAASFLQTVSALVAIAGALWLLALWALEWLRVPTDTVAPEINGWPVPTLLLIAGVVVGLLLTWLFAAIAAGGGRRRARRVRAQVAEVLEPPADELVLEPIRDELQRLSGLGADLDFVARA